jgi:ankyrin repeat protein
MAGYGRKSELEALFGSHRAKMEQKINTTVNENGYTMLICAAMNGHTDTVKMLVEHKANIDSQHKYGWTALMYAARNGHTATVKMLVAVGWNTQLKDNFGRTALDWAEENSKTDIITYLFQMRFCLANMFWLSLYIYKYPYENKASAALGRRINAISSELCAAWLRFSSCMARRFS